MMKNVLYLILLTFFLYSCHTDYRSKINNAILSGNDELAISYLDKAIEDDPSTEFLYMRADCEMKVGKYENALRDYERLLQPYSTEKQDIDSYIDISKDSSVNINSIYEKQLSAYYHLGRVDAAERKFAQLSPYFEYHDSNGQADYWNGMIAKKKGHMGDAYCCLRNASKKGNTNAFAEFKKIAKDTGRPSEIPSEVDSTGMEIQFTDGTKWHFGKQGEETQEPVKVEKKQIAVDYLQKYILMNHLNRNALKYIPGMRNKEKKPATICLAYFQNKIIQITKLPNGNQLPETLLKKHDVCSNDYASPSKPLVLDVWVLKYQNAQGEKTCELYLI